MNPTPSRWPAIAGFALIGLVVLWIASMPFQLAATEVTWTEFKQLVVDGDRVVMACEASAQEGFDLAHDGSSLTRVVRRLISARCRCVLTELVEMPSARAVSATLRSV